MPGEHTGSPGIVYFLFGHFLFHCCPGGVYLNAGNYPHSCISGYSEEHSPLSWIRSIVYAPLLSQETDKSASPFNRCNDDLEILVPVVRTDRAPTIRKLDAQLAAISSHRIRRAFLT